MTEPMDLPTFRPYDVMVRLDRLERQQAHLVDGLAIVAMALTFGFVLDQDRWNKALVDAGTNLIKCLPEDKQREIMDAVKGNEGEDD